jgi:hypothetical protein
MRFVTIAIIFVISFISLFFFAACKVAGDYDEEVERQYEEMRKSRGD